VTLNCDNADLGSPVTVTSPTFLTFHLADGLPPGEGNVVVSDSTDGDMTALVDVGAKTATVSPDALPQGYSYQTISITTAQKALKPGLEAAPLSVDTQGTWAQSYVSTACGIVGGYDSSHFGPNTRSPGSGS